ncbi:hypothetical protein [Paenibacillus sp. 203]|uniref:hypothetical protein n=1 Tax=Paenibacillus sp. 203 TaxID=3096765 RepID=UPI0030097DD7
MSMTLAQPTTSQATQLRIGSMEMIQYDYRQFPDSKPYQHHCCGLLTMSCNLKVTILPPRISRSYLIEHDLVYYSF